MKAKNKLFIVLIVLCIVVMMSCSIAIVFAANPGVDVGPEDKSFNYKGEVGLELSGDGTYYSVTRCEDLNGDHKVIIPDTYDNIPVTDIESGAVNDINVWSLTLGENVSSILGGAIQTPLLSINIPDSFYMVDFYEEVFFYEDGMDYYDSTSSGVFDYLNICLAGYEEDFSEYSTIDDARDGLLDMYLGNAIVCYYYGDWIQNGYFSIGYYYEGKEIENWFDVDEDYLNDWYEYLDDIGINYSYMTILDFISCEYEFSEEFRGEDFVKPDSIALSLMSEEGW